MTLVIKSKVLTPFNVYIESNTLSLSVKTSSSGRVYCGPCQLDDRAKCALLNDICWKSYTNYAVEAPFYSTDCFTVIAPICYNIWNSTNNLQNYQCKDFVNSLNYTAMQIKPAVNSSRYISTGKAILLEFTLPMRQSNWYDCNNVFDKKTLNWLPTAKSCRWTSSKILEIDYDPRYGIMQELTILNNSFYYNYPYSQEAARQITVKIDMPPLEATIEIKGISSVSECGTVELFGAVTTPTIFPLIFKWQVSYNPTPPETLLNELNLYLEPFKSYSQNSTLTIPSRLLLKNTKISVTLYAKAANFDSNEISANKEIEIFDNIPRLTFTSKPMFALELNGNKSNSIPFQLDNFRCPDKNNNEKEPDLTSIPVDIGFYISSGYDESDITYEGPNEISIRTTVNNNYAKFKALFIGSNQGFKYLNYYNITGVVKSKESGRTNSDTLIVFIAKPPLKSIISSPGSLVSIEFDVILSSRYSEFPATEDDTRSYLWKCIKASPMEQGKTCECPILADSAMKVANLRLPKEKLVNMCKYKYALTVMATSQISKGTFTRSAYNETEFMTFAGPAAPMESKVMKSKDDVKAKFTYLTFGTSSLVDTNTKYKWVLNEIESTNPHSDEKYSVKNTFIYDFFNTELKANIDPNIKTGDTPIPTSRLRRLADLVPEYPSGDGSRILAIDQESLEPQYKYTFAVTMSNGEDPSFLFVAHSTPPAPRLRTFTITPTTGIAFETQFTFTFTLPSGSDDTSDDASYQILRRDCPGSGTELSPLIRWFSKSNTFTTPLASGLKSCNYQVELVLRVLEYGETLDITNYAKVTEPEGISAEQVVTNELQKIENNADLTIDQKLSILSEISKTRINEDTVNGRENVNKIISMLTTIDSSEEFRDIMEPEDRFSIMNTTISTLSNLIYNQKPVVSSDQTVPILNKVNSYLTEIQKQEGGNYIINNVLRTLSGIKEVAAKDRREYDIYPQIQKPLEKMSEIKLTEVQPGGPPIQLTSPFIDLTVKKDYADSYNLGKNFSTYKGASINLPTGMADLFIKSMNENYLGDQYASAGENASVSFVNTSKGGTVTFGAKIIAGKFNPYPPIKNNTNISVESLNDFTNQGFRSEAIVQLYNDFANGYYADKIDINEPQLDLIQISFQPYDYLNNASEILLPNGINVGNLPFGKEITCKLPTPQITSAYANRSLLIPLYYVSSEQKWYNNNCTIKELTDTENFVKFKCTHMGQKNLMNIKEAFTVSVDIVEDVVALIQAGNYQQLTNPEILTDISNSVIIAYACIGIVLALVLLIEIYLIFADNSALYLARLRCILFRFNKPSQSLQVGTIYRVTEFFVKMKKSGMFKIAKENQRTVEPQSKPVFTDSNLINRKKPNTKKTIKHKRTNGFNSFNEEEEQELYDIYMMFVQCRMMFENEETVQELLMDEFEKSQVLNRITQSFIDDSILHEQTTLWVLIKHEHPLINALFRPELTTPRPVKFLIFMGVLFGELFVTGYFHDANSNRSISEETTSRVLSNSIVYSLAANLLMIPLKIINAVFSTGVNLTSDMTRSEVMSAEWRAPIFRFIGVVFGHLWILACAYGIMIYVVSFSSFALNYWMMSFGISVFMEIFLLSQLKVILKVIIGIILMKCVKRKFMVTTAGIIASAIVNWIASLC